MLTMGAVNGIDPAEIDGDCYCEELLLFKVAKSKRKPFPRQPRRTCKVGEIFYADLAGKFKHKSLGGSQHFLLMKDDACGFRTVYFLKHKSDTAKCLEEYFDRWKNTLQKPMKVLKSANGGEFISKEVEAILQKFGIEHETSAPEDPESNGVIVCEMRTVKEAARTMLYTAKLPVCLWAEAVGCAVYSLNSLLSSRSPGRTPYERVY